MLSEDTDSFDKVQTMFPVAIAKKFLETKKKWNVRFLSVVNAVLLNKISPLLRNCLNIIKFSFICGEHYKPSQIAQEVDIL